MLFIGVPSYSGKIDRYTMVAILQATRTPGLVGGFAVESSSLLTLNLNRILARALNDREKLTHLAILHADIEVEQGWADKMLAIMEEKKCDILSAVIPIKNEKNTSTAIHLGGHDKKILTLDDCEKRGRTFTDENLLVNTGLMLIDLKGEWVEGVVFKMEDGIIEKNGEKIPYIFTEDWCFSRDAREKGAKIYATNEVKVWHLGGGRWFNQVEGDCKCKKSKELKLA